MTDVPIIGAPTLVAATAIVVLVCCCETKPPLQVVAGHAVPCPVCRRSWLVTADLKVRVVPVAPQPTLDTQDPG